MRNPRKLISLFIIISIFISNVGFVFKYDCCVETAEIVFNVLNEDKCCVEIVEAKVDECCSVEFDETASVKTMEHNCGGHCFTTSEYKKLDIEQISYKVEIIKHYFEEITTISLNEIKLVSNHIFQSDEDIHLLSSNFGKHLLITIHKIKIPSPSLFSV